MSNLIPPSIVLLDVALVILFISLIFRLPLARWVGKYAVLFGFLISLAAVSGSLFYSEVVGFEPCLLCWYQRIAIYPLLVLFTVAMFNKKDRGVFKYALPLAVIAAVIALYHSYVQWGGTPLIPCDSTASCAKLYVYAYGYVTIPTMSLSVALAMILLWWSNKMRSIL